MTRARANGHRKSHAVIGVDMGGTSLSGGIVTHGGDVLDVMERPTHARGPGAAVDQLLDVITTLQARAAQLDVALDGVGVGLPGVVDVDEGVMVGDVILVPELTDVPIVERIHDATGLAVVIDNDVNCLALAEHRYGSASARSLVVLALGSGPGGGIVIEGTLVRGRHGYAGEFGHVPIRIDGEPCLCGRHSCASPYVAAEQIAHRARLAAREHPDAALLSLAGGNPDAITSRTVFAAAHAGDALASRFVDETCEAVAAMLGTIVNGLNPDVILITGGMSASLVALEADIRRRAGKYAFARALADTTITIAERTKRDTVRGGAALFLYEAARRVRRAPAGSSKRA